MALAVLEKYLDENHIKYETVKHSPAYTAQETAQAAHIPGKDLLKPVVVKINGDLALMIEPSTENVNLAKLKRSLNTKDVRIAKEHEFNRSFPDCDIGAMPIFGNLFNIPVYASKSLKDEKMIAFNAGNHEELIKMNWKDFLKLVHPKIVDA